MTVRSDLLDVIRPFLPEDWTLQNYTDEPDVLAAVAVGVEAGAGHVGDPRGDHPRHHRLRVEALG